MPGIDKVSLLQVLIRKTLTTFVSATGADTSELSSAWTVEESQQAIRAADTASLAHRLLVVLDLDQEPVIAPDVGAISSWLL